MKAFILHLVLTALALIVVANLVGGVHVGGFLPALIAALILGLVNAVVRPVMILLTLPLTIVTLGLFLFVVNALLLMLAAWLAPDFAIRSFWSALALAVIVTVINAVLGSLLTEKKR